MSEDAYIYCKAHMLHLLQISTAECQFPNLLELFLVKDEKHSDPICQFAIKKEEKQLQHQVINDVS